MASHRYVLSAGHRNVNRGGANNEINWTYPSVVALKAAIIARGGKAWIVQEEDGDADNSFYVNGGLQQAAQKCVSLATKYGTFDAYISSHYNGGASPGFHVIFPDAPTGGADVKAGNSTDVRLCRRVRDAVKATGTVRMLSWTADSPGVMSERETRVGSEGNRLGEFYGTLGFRATTARIILEASSIDVASERAYINDPRWVRDVYSEAIVDALEAEYGKFSTNPVPVPTSEYAKPVVIPELVLFRDRDDSLVPAAITTALYGPLYFIGRDVTVTNPTKRNRDTEGTVVVGVDLKAGEKFYAWFGGVKAGRPFIVTKWWTIIWLADTDAGVPE